jgi:hypothetical protein
MLNRLFQQHPASVGETYGEHFVTASSFARWLFVAALACLVHAVLPCLFEKTASRIIDRLYQRMIVSRHKNLQKAAESAPSLVGAERVAS